MPLRRRHAATQRRIRLMPSMLLAAAAALAWPTGTSAGIHGADGKLAFESDRSGNADIWITETDRLAPPLSEPKPIAANSPARESRPAWAPTAALTRVIDAFPADFEPGDPLPATFDPGDEVLFIFERGNQPQLELGWQVTIRWPGLSTATAAAVTGPEVVRATVPDGAYSGRPCVSILNKGVVSGWPARRLSPNAAIRDRPVVDDTAERCDQPLAFQSDREGRWDVFLHDPMSGDVRNATPSTPASDETAPAWSSQNGTGQDRSSDRTTPLLAFASNRTGKGDIFVVDPLTGGDPVNVTNTPLDDEANPDWASFGSWLTFEREQSGDRQLWAMRIDPVTNAPGPAHRVTADLGPSTEPSWLTWGKTFDIASAEEIAFDGPGENGDLELHHVEAPLAATPFGDPSLVTQWTAPGSALAEMHPAWSPQGTMLAFASDRSETAGDAAGDTNLWVRPYEPDRDEWLVTSGPGNDVHPAWQPQYLPASVYPTRPRGRASRRKRARVSVVSVDPGPGTGSVPGPGTGPRPGTSGRCSMRGTARADILRGTRRADVICGLGGADRLLGRGGRDVLLGGAGPDDLIGGAGDDRASGGPGADRLRGGAGRDRLSGGPGSDALFGGAAADRLIGGAGRDRALRDRRDTVTKTEQVRWR